MLVDAPAINMQNLIFRSRESAVIPSDTANTNPSSPPQVAALLPFCNMHGFLPAAAFFPARQSIESDRPAVACYISHLPLLF
jgi:hypothetical protein